MSWKKSLFIVMLVGMMLLAVAGCGKAEESVPAAEQIQPSMEQSANNSEGEMPAPPGGGAAGEMPAPPEGGAAGGRPSAPEVDLAAAAAKLGATEQQLSEALGDFSQGPLNLATAAEKLGVSEESLREALGFPEGDFPPGGQPPTAPESATQGQ
jgi:hypothetical protein